MKKHLLLLLAVVGFAFTASAQKNSQGMKLGIAADLYIPMGDASDVYNIGFGGTLKFEAPIATSTYFTANAGYASLQIKSSVKSLLNAVGYNKSASGAVPVLAGVKYYINNQFYAEGQLGAAIGTDEGSSTAFAYSPGVGFTFPVANGNAFDAGIRYEAWSKDGTVNLIGFRVAYKFSL